MKNKLKTQKPLARVVSYVVALVLLMNSRSGCAQMQIDTMMTFGSGYCIASGQGLALVTDYVNPVADVIRISDGITLQKIPFRINTWEPRNTEILSSSSVKLVANVFRANIYSPGETHINLHAFPATSQPMSYSYGSPSVFDHIAKTTDSTGIFLANWSDCCGGYRIGTFSTTSPCNVTHSGLMMTAPYQIMGIGNTAVVRGAWDMYVIDSVMHTYPLPSTTVASVVSSDSVVTTLGMLFPGYYMSSLNIHTGELNVDTIFSVGNFANPKLIADSIISTDVFNNPYWTSPGMMYKYSGHMITDSVSIGVSHNAFMDDSLIVVFDSESYASPKIRRYNAGTLDLIDSMAFHPNTMRVFGGKKIGNKYHFYGMNQFGQATLWVVNP